MIIHGDNLDALAQLPDNSIDSIVTDPPYGLGSPPDPVAMLRDWLAARDHETGGSGFMNKKWDAFVPGPRTWAECLRVLKPGGHMCAFAGSRTIDIMGLAIRIGGFEIRDSLQWLYGTGFPKSLNVSKAIAPIAAKAWADVGCEYARTQDEEDADGFGTALKPAHEPIILARKPLSGTVAATVLEHGTGALNIDACRIGYAGAAYLGVTQTKNPGRADAVASAVYGENRPQQRVEPAGRWPANVILDPEAGAMLDAQSGIQRTGTAVRGNNTQGGETSIKRNHAPGTADMPARERSGGASRFFYCAKTSPTEREAGLAHIRQASAGELTGGRAEGSAGLDNPRAGAGRTSNGRANVHPTVKPIALMRWLIRLVTPPGGTVIDPYAGSGTTGCAAALERRPFLGMELDPDEQGFVEIARARIAYWSKQKP